MAERMITCAKLKQELPAIDPASPTGQQALKLALLLGGRELQQRIANEVSQEAWRLWTEHMLMVINEFRLDPTADESNRILGQQMQAFFFGEAARPPGYVPPKD
jgi:Fe-S cluster biosynthesis and repair protein YggX